MEGIKSTKQDKTFLQLFTVSHQLLEYAMGELKNIEKHKNSLGWKSFVKRAKKARSIISELGEELAESIKHLDGKFVSEVQQLANAQLNTLIKEDRWFQDTFVFKGSPVSIIVEEESKGNYSVIHISKGIKESDISPFLRKVKNRFKAESVRMGVVEPYEDISECRHLKNAKVKDAHDTEYAITGMAMLDGQLGFTLQRTMVLDSASLSRHFVTSDNKKIGRNIE